MTYRRTAEAAWQWVLDQVCWDDGPWIPASVPPADPAPPGDRDGMHSGIGGLAYVLAEIRLARPWSAEERELADAVVRRIQRSLPTQTDVTFFDGLVSSIGVMTTLDRRNEGGGNGIPLAVARLHVLATHDGWPQTEYGPPRYLPDARVNDLTLGTAGVLLGALWARRAHAAGADELAEHAAAVLLAESETEPTGTSWRFIPMRYCPEARGEMPNLSHGTAGIAATLAMAGFELGRPDLLDVARRGAEHLVTLADTRDNGLLVLRTMPHTNPDTDEVTFTWCHGPTGSSHLFLALDRAGVDDVAGESPMTWHRRCLHSARTSGLPERLHPGFWDNDGQCCGTAGVGEVFLDSWQRTGQADDLAFAVRLADTLVARAVTDGPHAYWRFVEHRADDPLLPPGVGWMQGAAGIAAFLFRVARLVEVGPEAEAVARMDTVWRLPPQRPLRPT